MKFIKEHLATMEGIEIFPLISFSIFGLFFIGLLYWVFRMDKQKIKEISNYPLRSDND